jgi:hypothetical protein
MTNSNLSLAYPEMFVVFLGSSKQMSQIVKNASIDVLNMHLSADFCESIEVINIIWNTVHVN